MPAPTTRVLAALELLQNHRRISGAELAERLGVDRRTVRRYITVLEDLGVPVTTELGRYGGYMLVPGFKLPPMMFNDEEALAISLGLLAARELGMAQATPDIASAEAKLERVMPDNLKQRARTVRETTKLIFPRPDLLPDDRVLVSLTRAIQAEQRVGFVYQPPEQAATQREVDPYGLAFRRGHWYMSGYCHLRKDMRSFRLDRIRNIQTLSFRFQRPANFDAAEHLMHSLRALPRNQPVSVLLHTDEETARKALRFYPSAPHLFEKHQDGLLFNTRTDCTEWFACWLLGLPFDFTVLGPDALKRTLREYAGKLVRACGAP